MPMHYEITSATMGIDKSLDISETEYCQLLSVKQKILEATYLEEKMDLVAENYFEFEEELLRIACRMIIFSEDLQLINQYRTIINRRMMNLLSTGRMYIDHSMHHLHNLFDSKQEIISIYEQKKDSILNQYFGYRLMDAIRNYVQHRGYAVHAISTERKIQHEKLLHRAIPFINLPELNNDKKFKRSVLSELMKIHKEESIDIRPYIRQYFTTLVRLHEETRKMLILQINTWDKQIITLFQKFDAFNKTNEPVNTLLIISRDDNEKIIDKQYLNRRIIERRAYYELKNRHFNDFTISYSSNEI
jgi:hypothetical protein